MKLKNCGLYKYVYTQAHVYINKHNFSTCMRSIKITPDFLFVGSLSITRTLFAMSFNYENTGLKGNKS